MPNGPLKTLKDTGADLQSAIEGSLRLAGRATADAVVFAGQAEKEVAATAGVALDQTGQVTRAALEAAGKLGVTAANVVGNTGSKLMKNTGAVVGTAGNIVKDVASTAGSITHGTSQITATVANTASQLTSVAAGATIDLSKVAANTSVSVAKNAGAATAAISAQAGKVTKSAAGLVGSTTTAVLDQLTSFTRFVGERGAKSIRNSNSRNALNQISGIHDKQALKSNYNQMMTRTLTEYSTLFNDYNNTFKDIINIFKKNNCQEKRFMRWIRGPGCGAAVIANIESYKMEVSRIGAKFRENLNKIKHLSMKYELAVDSLSATTINELFEKEQAVTREHLATIRNLLQEITDKFDALFTKMQEPVSVSGSTNSVKGGSRRRRPRRRSTRKRV